jgi:hypothetical protein
VAPEKGLWAVGAYILYTRPQSGHLSPCVIARRVNIAYRMHGGLWRYDDVPLPSELAVAALIYLYLSDIVVERMYLLDIISLDEAGHLSW